MHLKYIRLPMPNKIVQKSLRLALQLFPGVYASKKRIHPKKRVFHFAFAFTGRRLLAIGQNEQFKPNCKVFKFAQKFNIKHWKEFPFYHAELDVISRLWGKYYVDSYIKLVVLRLNKYAEICDSKPCHNCTILLQALNVQDVWWSKKDGTFGYGI